MKKKTLAITYVIVGAVVSVILFFAGGVIRFDGDQAEDKMSIKIIEILIFFYIFSVIAIIAFALAKKLAGNKGNRLRL